MTTTTEPTTARQRTDSPPEPQEKSRPIPAFVRARIAVVRWFLAGYARLFGLSGLYRFGQVFGMCEYLCDYRRRGRVHARLKQHFKDTATPTWRRRVTRQYFMRIRCDKIFYTIMDRIPRDKLMSRIKIFGLHHLDEALARGNGVYVALCHYGAHHVAGLMAALLGYKLTGVRDPKESHVRRYIQQKYRETFPEIAAIRLFMNDSFPRELYRDFKSNRIVASLLDVDAKRAENLKTQPVQVFGETREYLTGPLRIAIRCGAPVIQGFVISRKNFYYRLIATPPILDPATVTGENDDVVARTLQFYADRVEEHARAYPDHLMKI